MKRPVPLTIIATLWFIIGVCGVMVDQLRNHRLDLMNSHVLNILVGIGLLSYWRIARWYALVMAGCTFVFILVGMPWMIFDWKELAFDFPSILIDQRPHATVPLIIVISILLTYLAVSGSCFWVLSRRETRELFAQKSSAANRIAVI